MRCHEMPRDAEAGFFVFAGERVATIATLRGQRVPASRRTVIMNDRFMLACIPNTMKP